MSSVSANAAADRLAEDFVAFSVQAGVLRFGEFKTKAGRLSPYFFNSGLFDDGAKLGRLAEFYARRLLASRLAFDMLFGPAYKGITLAAATAIELARLGRNVPYCHNRKEAKDHGEGGLMVGAPLKGRAEPVAVLIAMDRMERGGRDDNLSERSAVEGFERAYGIPVLSIATLTDLMHYLRSNDDPQLARHFAAVSAYRDRYGI
jgi:orotate phosphoribosyltransferase